MASRGSAPREELTAVGAWHSPIGRRIMVADPSDKPEVVRYLWGMAVQWVCRWQLGDR